MHTNTHPYRHTPVQIHTHTGKRTQIHTHTHTGTLAHAHTHTYTHIHRYTHTHTQTYTHTHTNTHIHKHTRTHIHTHTHIVSLHNGGRGLDLRRLCNTLQHTATRCNIPHHIAIHCNTLQRITLQHNVTHYTTLQHTVTSCNTLQHTATHCNTQWRYITGGSGGICGDFSKNEDEKISPSENSHCSFSEIGEKSLLSLFLYSSIFHRFLFVYVEFCWYIKCLLTVPCRIFYTGTASFLQSLTWWIHFRGVAYLSVRLDESHAWRDSPWCICLCDVTIFTCEMTRLLLLHVRYKSCKCVGIALLYTCD